MDYKKKYIKYKQKYKTIKYGGSIDSKNSTTYKRNGSNKPIRRKPPPPDVHISSIMFSDFEDYKKTMNLFYELTQLNLEAEQLQQEMLNAGFSFSLTYKSWTWTNADNHQFADMNLKLKESLRARQWMSRGNAAPGDLDQWAATIIKESNIKFAFLTHRMGSSYWLYGKSYEEIIKDFENRFKIIEDQEKFIEFLEKIKLHHTKFKKFLDKYDIDISRTVPEIVSNSTHMNEYILGLDADAYLIKQPPVIEKKIHVIPSQVFHNNILWNDTQYEWLRKLNNFFMYEKKKELYESYCNLRLCDIHDFIEQ